MIEKVTKRCRDRQNPRIAELGTPSLLAYPSHTDAARMVMVNNHLGQRVVLKHTELPRVFTNYENVVGDESSYNHTASDDLEILKIFHKFKDVSPDTLDFQPALFFVYNKTKNQYDVIQRIAAEDLMEKYGFDYDNSFLNSYKEGDVIKKDATISRPTSFDSVGNYGFGMNVPTMLLACNEDIEDGIMISDTFANTMLSVEVESCRVPLNDNDIFVDIYGGYKPGTDTYCYRGFPGIGECVKGKTLCNIRRITKRQILYDLKSSNTKKMLDTDITYFAESGAVVYDIDIHCNKDISKIPRTEFNKQLLDYLEAQINYATEVRDFTYELIHSGVPCSSLVRAIHQEMVEYLDEQYDFRDDTTNSTFSYIVMEFHVKRDVGIHRGQKITGRYGNKGVVTTIVPVKLMPIMENGKRIHVVLSVLGPHNRLNIFQLKEISINFILDRTIEHFDKNNLPIEDRERILFDILGRFNKSYAKTIERGYKKRYKTKKAKEQFFAERASWTGVNIKPFMHEENIYEAIQSIYEDYPFIKPYKAYFWEQATGRYVRMMNDIVASDMYFMKLKQSSKKNLSVSSFAPIGQVGLPEKTDMAKKHRAIIPPTPIKFGRQELLNIYISIQNRTYAKLHTLYRTSPIARRELGSAIIDNYGKNLPVNVELNDRMSNRAVEILNARLLAMGIGIEFEEDELDLPQLFGEEYNKDEFRVHTYQGDVYIARPDTMLQTFAREEAKLSVENNVLGSIFIGNEGQAKEEFIDHLADLIYNDILSYGDDTWFQNKNQEVIE